MLCSFVTDIMKKCKTVTADLFYILTGFKLSTGTCVAYILNKKERKLTRTLFCIISENTYPMKISFISN